MKAEGARVFDVEHLLQHGRHPAHGHAPFLPHAVGRNVQRREPGIRLYGQIGRTHKLDSLDDVFILDLNGPKLKLYLAGHISLSSCG
jgi:hypothetical protein